MISVENLGLYSALKSLVSASLVAQSEQLLIEERRIGGSYLHDFCTVKMSTARRTGHTEAMIWTAMEMFQDPIFIVVHKDRSDFLAKTLHRECDIPFSDCRSMVYNVSDLPRRTMGLRPDSVFVDNASTMTVSDLNKIYELSVSGLSGHNRFCLVLIQ